MRYFKYKNTDKNLSHALKAQYQSLTAEEKRTFRREKRWRWMHNALFYLIFFTVLGCFVWMLKAMPLPEHWLLRLLAILCGIILALFLCVLSGALALWMTTPLRKKADSFHIPSMKKKFFSEACHHLREYYGLEEPYQLTKCFEATDRSFINHDVCIFSVGEELRITTDLVNGFLHGQRDLGCYAFGRDEIILNKQRRGDQLILELIAGDAVFLLGYRAKGFIEKNFLTKQSTK